MAFTQVLTAVEDEPDDVLDKLEELSIINIDVAQGDSPSSATTSLLPTPPVPHVVFSGSMHYHPTVHIWQHHAIEDMGPIQPPGAPLMKDLDSFTDGSGTGTFDELPPLGMNESGDYIHPANEITLSLLPTTESLSDFIEKWRADVLEDTSLPVKRRRSPSPEVERPPAKRTRPPRFRAASLPVQLRGFTDDTTLPTARSEPDTPD